MHTSLLCRKHYETSRQIAFFLTMSIMFGVEKCKFDLIYRTCIDTNHFNCMWISNKNLPRLSRQVSVLQVSQTGTDIICHILDAQLLMTEDLWKEALSSLMKSLPVLQVYTVVQVLYMYIHCITFGRVFIIIVPFVVDIPKESTHSSQICIC